MTKALRRFGAIADAAIAAAYYLGVAGIPSEAPEGDPEKAKS
ncbi:MAG: hypothetical protein ACREXW_03130 [Gammaproteobacteria bacterium]